MAPAATLSALIRSMRPRQWSKNLIVFAPGIFAGAFVDSENLIAAAVTFVAMCVLSGAIYLLNDLSDIAADRAYTRTRQRPLAASQLAPSAALMSAVALALVSIAAGYAIRLELGHVLGLYLVLQLAYTTALKRLVIVDVLTIAAGFLLRAVAGATAIDLPHSPWLLTCAAFLVLFLAVGKRRQELQDMGDDAPRHRSVLARYSMPQLNVMISVAATATVVSYLLYTLVGSGAEIDSWMPLTSVFVVYGVFRYLSLLYSDSPIGTAEEILVTDRPLIASVVMWLLAVFVLIYV